MPNVDSIWLKTNKLSSYHYGCHSNLVTKATRHVADACHPKKGSYQNDLNRTQDKRVIYIKLWLP